MGKTKEIVKGSSSGIGEVTQRNKLSLTLSILG